ncbi:MAG TPA: adenylate/guanylate cyclase domain-containing protein [Gaiellaceae bacterium]|nr:adenylate/guanylate cyclase domain-containing protein [Gaiellaceae bacterium]
MPPETRYARSGDVSIAYQVVGDGPFDVVFVPPSSSHVELGWEVPTLRVLFDGISAFARLIVFDKRGTGMSDPVAGVPSLETRMDDVRAVMDASGSERAAIMGWSEGVAMSALFAATYPQRAWALVLYGGFARELRAHDYPWGETDAEALRVLDSERNSSDRAALVAELARSGMPTGTDEEIAALARLMRQSISPGASEALARMNIQIDIRHVLPAIRVPSLVLHNSGDRWVEIERGRDLANRIPGAEFVEFPSDGHITPAAEMPRVLDEIERFLQAAWETDARREPDRQLATLLFTDIVDSTTQLTKLGDAGWREVLERHHALVRSELARARGTEVDTAGDGFFAAFDGPARAVRCAKSIVDRMHELGLDVRSGLHTGECEIVDGKVSGIAVHTGARVAAHAGPGEVLVSSTVKDLVAGSGLEFEDRGVHELKGIPGEWRLYAAL